jgi:hypothetical protein
MITAEGTLLSEHHSTPGRPLPQESRSYRAYTSELYNIRVNNA